MKTLKYDYPIFFKDNNKPKNPIIFVHGFNSMPEIHNVFMDQWTLSDYYALAFPGNNMLEPKNGDDVSVESFADLIIKFIKDNNLKDVVLIGHSMGGGTISLTYKKEPKLFVKMIYVSPMNKTLLERKEEFFKLFSPTTFEAYKNLLATLSPIYGQALQDPMVEARERKNFESGIVNNPYIMKLGYSLADENLHNAIEAGIKSIDVPILLVLGESDMIINCEKTKAYFKTLAKKIRVEVIQNAGHVPFYENFIKYFTLLTEFYLEK
ncbi:triacylglycerol lipase [Mycoplasmopsis mustelae]|uniref:Triacylglycerol lipase n=1 Tax=Mycoplasmopsis mustelae TaxID=171289 RepID=A0A4R7UEW5_9BACT|nr:alpha/beta hydrolase [Mycoplasmopsis mustelae]TDV24433.1 triacylglycerol lipase [Mycoplasmopsis mustelae]